jgi:hypothetical protein
MIHQGNNNQDDIERPITTKTEYLSLKEKKIQGKILS